MKTLREIVKDIRKIKTTIEDFEEEVIVAFEDYTCNGNSEVIVEKAIGQNYDYITYINAKNSTEIYISIEKKEKDIFVRDVWTSEKEEKLKEDIKRVKNSLYKYFTEKKLYRCFFELGKVSGLELLSYKRERKFYSFVFKHKKTFDTEYTVLLSKINGKILVITN